MNNIFSFKRFGLLFGKHIREERSRYLLSAAALFAILFSFYLIVILTNLSSRFLFQLQEALFFLGMLFSTTIFSSMSYQFFQQKAKGIQFLQLPASSAEKLLVSFIITQICFFLLYLCVFYTADWIVCHVYNSFHKMPANVTPEYAEAFTAKIYPLDTVKARQMIAIAVILSSVAHYGSLCFEKQAYIKTTICVIAAGFVLIWGNYHHLKGIIPQESMPKGTFYNEGARLMEAKGPDEFIATGYVNLPESWNYFIPRFIAAMLFICFWTASYFKLKEKQV